MDRLARAIVDRLLNAFCAENVAVAVLGCGTGADHPLTRDAIHLLRNHPDEVPAAS